MNYLRRCNFFNEYIKNYPLSIDDLNLFYEFLSKRDYFKANQTIPYFFRENRAKIVEEWFYFLQEKRPDQKSSGSSTYGSTVYRATFGDTYTLEQLASNPLYFSAGSNGSGLYAAVDDNFGKSYIKGHLHKQFKAFDNNQGNVLKIDVKDDAKIMSKIDIHRAKNRFIEEISQMNIDADLKNAFIEFIDSDVSISAILLGADMMYLPNGHVVILNKNSLLFPQTPEGFENHTLRVDLEKFRAKNLDEIQKVDDFMQPQ